MVESLISNIKANEKYTSEFCLLNDINYIKDIRH